jgi:hypothetical protein
VHLQGRDIQYASVNIYTSYMGLVEFGDDIAWFLGYIFKQDKGDQGRCERDL